jgi:Domain of unknown function (DUF1814).
MSEQLKAILKRKSEEITNNIGIGPETRYNSYKEELQFYVLNFIYHHPEYSKWIMYGGSALRIIHGLDRMSVDLDFETPHIVTDESLVSLKKNIEEYFSSVYDAGEDFLTVKISGARGLLLKFHLSDELSAGHSSKQVHVKIDLNYFVATKTVVERRPINHGQLSFVILTYNMGALMASKIAAIFLRGTRQVGDVSYEEKGRDIYDLLWYMGKRVIPDLDYLKAKSVDVSDMRALFDKLTLQMNKVSDENLKNDLLPLFINRSQIEDWLKNWRESYAHLLDDYRIHKVTKLKFIAVNKDFDSMNYSFAYGYETEEGDLVKIAYNIGNHFLDYHPGDISTKINKAIIRFVEGGMKDKMTDKYCQYATLFYDKTEAYLKKTGGVVLGDIISTKIVVTTAGSSVSSGRVLKDKKSLLSCELKDLL